MTRARVTWWYEFPPSVLLLSLQLYCRRVGAIVPAVLFFLFFPVVQASQKVGIVREFSVGFRGRKQRRLSQSRVWIYVQDSAGVGFAD